MTKKMSCFYRSKLTLKLIKLSKLHGYYFIFQYGRWRNVETNIIQLIDAIPDKLLRLTILQVDVFLLNVWLKHKMRYLIKRIKGRI